VAHVDRVVAAWDYGELPRSLVLRLKARGQRVAATELAAGIVDEVWRQGLAADVLTWIPARRADIRTRGFDHAELIARAVGRRLGLPVIRALEQRGERLDQTTLDASRRRANVKGVFVARLGPRRVGVVDDLMTTGSTLSEAGRALRAAGAVTVEGLVACVVS